jgi:hypothetical protein
LKQPAGDVKSSKTNSTKNIINRSRLVQKIPCGYTQKKKSTRSVSQQVGKRSSSQIRNSTVAILGAVRAPEAHSALIESDRGL